MQVDFYQLGASPPEQVVASIAEKVLAGNGRLVVVAGDDGALARLDRQLWGEQASAAFLPHGISGGADDARQPILLSTSPDAPNLARNLLIVDGEWRDAALSYERAFFLFDKASLVAARKAWKALADREGIERRYWAQEGGKWVNKS